MTYVVVVKQNYAAKACIAHEATAIATYITYGSIDFRPPAAGRRRARAAAARRRPAGK